jgi:hypothetical protein
MPNDNTDTASKLKKLGQRVRQGWTNRHPIPDQSLDTVRQTVRQEWQREQTQKRGKTAGGKKREPKPPEPER